MKSPLIIFRNILFIAGSVFLSSCLSDQYNQIEQIAASGFDFSTINKVNVNITALDNADQPVGDVSIRVYTKNPVSTDGMLLQDIENQLIYTGSTNAEGKMTCSISPSTTVDSLYILVNQIGFNSLLQVKTTPDIQLIIGGKETQNLSSVISSSKKIKTLASPTLVNGFYTLGSWTSNGTPNYLFNPGDVISAALLADINATLPEYKKLPGTHPEFFEDPKDGSINLYEDAEVFVTFIHEGAGWTNTLAYYTYPTSTPPSTISEIKDKTVIFPNFSFANGGGGGLFTGNKVQLFYYNQASKTYSNIFPKGTTVSWILHAQGWSGSNIKIANDKFMWYSDQKLNQEKDGLKKHNVVLRDSERNLLLIGFEDQQREGSDNDFNDAVFYAVTNPLSAINPSDYDRVIKVSDKDGDGVSDPNDEYPEDKTRAFNNYYPSKSGNATIAFEDLWPSKGDYDFNDLILDYHYNQITNSNNEVVAIDASYTLRAVGGSYKNGFGVQFNTSADNISEVKGQLFTDDILKINSNGTEANQTKAVIMVFDDALKILKHKGKYPGINTTKGSEFVEPVVINVSFGFIKPVPVKELGSAPYNPFIFVNGDRTREIHLPKNAPTDLADLKRFGRNDDDTKIEIGNYYMSQKYLPWVINFPTKFDYPAENQDITKAYLHFTEWATKLGEEYADWYESIESYRDNEKIYSK
jgi:LruC domain-containing protein